MAPRRLEEERLDLAVVDGRWRGVLDTLFTFVGLFSTDGVIVDVNRAPLEAAGLDRDQVIGRRFVDMPWWSHSQEERARIHDAIARAARGESLRFETNVRRLRGDIMYVDAAFAPVRDQGGAVVEVVGSGVDVTARRDAEAARARNGIMLAEAQRVAHVGSWEWDVARDTVTWSDELYRIYGLEPGAFRATFDAFIERVHVDDVRKTRAVIGRALRDVTPFVYDHRVVRPDGAVRMLHTRGEVIAGGDGRPLRMLGSCWDVTLRWQVEQRLEHSVSLLEATLEATADGLLVVDREGKVSAFNDRFLTLWQIPPELAERRADQDLLAYARTALEDPDSFDARVRTLYDRPEQAGLDMLRFKDGRVLERYSCPQRVSGEVVGRVWSFRDVTHKERLLRAAEQARSDAEGAYHALESVLERVSDGFAALDSASRYVYVNRCGGRMLGRDPADLVGKHIWTEFPEGREQEFRRAYERAAAEQSPVQVRAYYPPWDRWFENRIYPSPEGLSIFFRDVTAEERKDEQLRAGNQQLRALGARLEGIREEERRLLARELHDQIGQALTALKLDLAGLEARLPGGARALGPRLAAMYRLLDETLEATRRLSAELRPALIDELGLPAAIAAQARECAARAGLRVELDLAPAEALALEPPRALLLYRIFQEALTNVARHAGAGRVRVGLRVDGDDVVLEVADDGRGITADERTRSASLGLMGMQERAAALSGRLTVSGEPGGGTSVTVRVPHVAPRSQPEPEPAQRPEREPEHRSRRRSS